MAINLGEIEERNNKKTNNNYKNINGLKISTIKNKKNLNSNKKSTWFQKGAFSDGYDFGDATKSVLSTAGDVVVGLAKGVSDIGVSAGKLGAAGIAQVADWIGQDEYAKRVRDNIAGKNEKVNEIIKNYTPSGILEQADNKIDNSSLLGEKSDNISQGIGYYGGMTALQSVGVPWQVTSGVTSAGNEVSNAYGNNATNLEAWLSAGISAGIEIGTEKISGGLKLPGTGKTLDKITGGLTNKIKSNTIRKLAQLGIDMASEGIEEVISGLGSAIGRKITYMSEKELKELYSSEEALDEFINGALVAGITSSAGNLINNRINNTDSTQMQSISYSKENNPQSVYTYETTSNQKVNNLRKSASEYFNNSEQTHNFINNIEKIVSDKNYNVVFDSNIKNNGKSVNAQIKTLNNGEIEIKINPNSSRSGEFLIMHEVTHAIENESMKKLVMDYASKHSDFNAALESLKTTYGVDDVSSEVLADISGQLFGNQEFINNLSVEQPSIFRKIYNAIVSLANKITGNTNEALFIRDLKNKWEAAYRTQNNNINQDTQYSIGGINAINQLQDSQFKTDALNSYRIAQNLQKQNVDNESIRQQTKWFQDKNNDWKFEFDDNNLTINNKILQTNGKYKLSDIFNHNVLYKLYPTLKDYNVKFVDMKPKASHDGNKKILKINNDFIKTNNYKELKGTLLHELQHAIQKYENFESGTTRKLGGKQYFENLGEIEADDTKYRYMNDYNKEDRMNIAPESSKLVPKHKKYDSYMANRTVVDKFKDNIYNFAKDVKKSDEMAEENISSHQKRNNSLVDGRGLLNSSSFSMDNKGRKLTKAQQDFFKDSEIRDKNGKLKVLYHGTPFGKFTTFKGNMFFFSEDYRFAEDYANSKSFEQGLDGDINVIEAYLNAENVFDVNNQSDIQKLRKVLSDEINFWGRTWDKETLLKKLQRKDTLPPKWKSEQIEGKKFGDYIGDDRNGYNTDMFVGVNKKNEIVYISQERDLQKLSQTEKDMFEKKLMNGEEVSYVTYQTIFGELTKKGIEEKISEFQKQGEEYKKENGFENESIDYYIKELRQTLKWLEKDLIPETSHKLRPKTTTQESTELNDIDNWTYFETAFDSKTRKDIVDIVKDLGYDAINIYEEGKSNYIVFKPNQIKNVTNENPTSNEDIRYSQKNNKWQEYLEDNFKASGTRTNMQDIKLPIKKAKVSLPKQSSNENIEISKQKTMNPNEISNLKLEDANTTPKLPNVKRNKIGDGDSRFYENIRDKTNMLSDEQKTSILSEEEVQYYDKITNEESLNKAFERLEKNGQMESLNWFSKDSEKANSTDVAEGWILLKQYADNNDADGMVAVAKKLREIGTKAGQTVQAFNIMERMTPEGMVKYAQSELTEAYEKMIKNKSKEWIDKHQSDFDLNPEEVSFIMNTMEEVSKMEDGYEKRVKLAEIQKVMSDKLPPEKGAGIKSWMRISMLFNPKTQVRNVAGNAIIAPVNSFSDLFASGIDKLVSKKTGVRTTGTTNLKNYSKGFKKGLFESYNDFKKGINTRNIDGNRFELKQGKSFKNNNIIGKQLNRVDNLLSFMLDAGDRGFYEASFINSINNQMILNNTTEITQDMIDIATQEALSRTWQDNNNYTKFVLNVRKGLNKIQFGQYGLGDVLIPFAKTPANLTKAIVDYSPAGFVNTLISGNNLRKSISNGQYTAQMQHKFVQDLGKATAGTMLYILGYALATAGIVSGESDDDKDVKNFLQNTLGINSYSIKIGDKTFTYDWAQPVAAPLSITANIVNSKSNKETALLEAIVGSLDSAGSILLEQSFVQSINDVLNNNDGIVSGLVTEVLKLPARAIPTLSKQIADMVDGTQRQTFEYDQPIKSAVNYAKSKIPGLSKTLAPSVDTMGREIQKYGGKNNIFNVFINPANVNTENISKSAEEIYRLYKETGDTTIMPRVAPYYVNKNNEKIILNSSQRAKYQKTSGKIIEENIEKLLKNHQYKTMSDIEKVDIINNIVNYSYNIAQSEILGTEISQNYEKAYLYGKVGDVSDYYILKSQDFVADKDKEGNSISGSKKKKIVNYINSMNLSVLNKAILIKFNGYSINNYDKQIIEYINNQKLSTEEKIQLLTKMGYTIKNGRVYW